MVRGLLLNNIGEQMIKDFWREEEFDQEFELERDLDKEDEDY